jgi:hypothetical protein
VHRSAGLILLACCGLGACVEDDGVTYTWTPNGYAYHGSHYARAPRAVYAGELHGPGVGTLDEWLKGTREGRAVVTLGFREASSGYISEDVANRANIWFRRYADQNGDMIITDPEIRTALVTAAGRYLPRGGGPEDQGPAPESQP